MRIPRYWAHEAVQGSPGDDYPAAAAWGWSSQDQQAAQEHARERAHRILERLNGRGKASEYDYLSSPPREEVLDAIIEGDEEVALITRCRYGSLVINAASVCFVDVDFPPVRARGLIDGLRLIFAGGLRAQRAKELQAETIEGVRAWARANPRRTFRLYRTCAGLRLLLTDRLYDPLHPEVEALLKSLKADTMYLRLTQRQKCFRARLTPKPYRCGAPRPVRKFPYLTDADREAMEGWLEDYEGRSASFAVCRLIETFGRPALGGALARVVETHDRYALGAPDAPLA